jgi:DNA replication protein DnaC
MKAATENLEKAAVAQQCRVLRLPAVADQCASLAEVAIKQRQTYLSYLEALLAAELEERERNTIIRRIRDARLPRMKTLEDFDFSKAPQLAPTRIHELASGGYIERAEPVILIGDCGTAKPTYSPACAWLPVGRSGGFASPPPPHWSTNWSKRNSSSSCAECWRDGSATT